MKSCHRSKKVGFGIHLMNYVFVISGLWLIWALTGMGHPWPIYPTLGWGIGILGHYLGAGRPILIRLDRLRRQRNSSDHSTPYQESWNGHEVEVHQK